MQATDGRKMLLRADTLRARAPQHRIFAYTRLRDGRGEVLPSDPICPIETAKYLVRLTPARLARSSAQGIRLSCRCRSRGVRETMNEDGKIIGEGGKMKAIDSPRSVTGGAEPCVEVGQSSERSGRGRSSRLPNLRRRAKSKRDTSSRFPGKNHYPPVRPVSTRDFQMFFARPDF